MTDFLHLPALRGGLFALLAAALFGISTPLVQKLGVGLGAFSTAALLYAGAALIGLLSLRTAAHEARVQRSDIPSLLAMAGFGAALGPVALAWGLQHTSGASASLMLTLDALFTATLAWWRLSQIRRSLQNTNTEVNKPIQIQNSLAKGATCAACIDMDRSFVPPAKAYCRWADRTRRYVVSCFDVNGLLKVDQHWGVARAIPPARLRITSA